MKGVDLDASEETPSKPIKKEINNKFVFRDPSEYEHLTQEERNNLTKEMKENHARWAKEKSKLGD